MSPQDEIEKWINEQVSKTSSGLSGEPAGRKPDKELDRKFHEAREEIKKSYDTVKTIMEAKDCEVQVSRLINKIADIVDKRTAAQQHFPAQMQGEDHYARELKKLKKEFNALADHLKDQFEVYQ